MILIKEFCRDYNMSVALLELEGRVFGESKYTPEEVIEIASKEGNKIFVAMEENKLIGFISLLTVDTLHYRGLWIDLLGVDPNYRNRGIGQQLVSMGKDYGLKAGVNMISGLIAMENISSRRAFEKNNFEEVDKPYALSIATIK